MKKSILGLSLFVCLISGCSSDYSLGNAMDSTKDASMHTCILQEAKQKFDTNMVSMSNIKEVATEIATSCATKNAMDSSPKFVNDSLSALKSFM